MPQLVTSAGMQDQACNSFCLLQEAVCPRCVRSYEYLLAEIRSARTSQNAAEQPISKPVGAASCSSSSFERRVSTSWRTSSAMAFRRRRRRELETPFRSQPMPDHVSLVSLFRNVPEQAAAESKVPQGEHHHFPSNAVQDLSCQVKTECSIFRFDFRHNVVCCGVLGEPRSSPKSNLCLESPNRLGGCC